MDHALEALIAMTTAGEFCNRQVVVAKQGESLKDAAQRMLSAHVGCLVVVNDENGKRKPIGMLTDRDIVVGVLARTDRHLHSLTVGDVMSTDIVTAWEGERLQDTLERMCNLGIRRIPVVDRNGSLHGIVSFDDLLGLLQTQMSALASLLDRERKREIDARRAVR